MLGKQSATTMQSAFDLAEKEHEGQVRKQHVSRQNETDPYLIHPLRVCLILMNELQLLDVTSLAAAVLHDVVEDGNSRPSIEDIRSSFGDSIATTVNYLTKPDCPEGQKHTAESLRPYHESFYDAPLHVRLVKLSDRLDNLRETLLIDRPIFQQRYLLETQEIYLPLAAQTSLFFHAQYIELLKRLETMLAKSAGA